MRDVEWRATKFVPVGLQATSSQTGMTAWLARVNARIWAHVSVDNASLRIGCVLTCDAVAVTLRDEITKSRRRSLSAPKDPGESASGIRQARRRDEKVCQVFSIVMPFLD